MTHVYELLHHDGDKNNAKSSKISQWLIQFICNYMLKYYENDFYEMIAKVS